MGKQDKNTHKDSSHQRTEDPLAKLAKIIEEHLRNATGGDIHVNRFQLDLAAGHEEIRVSWPGAFHGTRHPGQDGYGHERSYQGTTIDGTYLREND